MSDRPANAIDSIRNMTATRRFLVLGATAVVLVGIWMVGRWATSPTYVPLYRDLELGEVGTIGDALDKADIQHRLGAGGTEVLVPAEKLARARVALARDGLAQAGRPGLELFDKPSWGMTDFTQRVTYQRALEGELARTIGGLRGVQHAQVHLVIPRTTTFRKAQPPAGASVVLTTTAGVSLSPETVRGITYIVANSVDQLSSDNVAVLDSEGRVLSMPAASESASGLTSRQLDIQRGVEEHLSGKVEELLATVVGTGQARAQVAAMLNFEQVDRTIESFDPEGQVVLSEARSEMGDQLTGPQTVMNNSYQNSRSMERIVGAVGGITRLTVAVLVDERTLQSGDMAQGGAANRLASIEAMVRDAIGIDDARGDRITVTSIPFEPVSVSIPVEPLGPAGQPVNSFELIRLIQQLSRPVLALAAIIAMLVLAWRALRMVPALPKGATGDSESIPQGTSTNPDLAAAETPSPALLQGHLQAVSADRPELTAQVVRSWLADS
jgi:flagellar M-ring protein FliF